MHRCGRLESRIKAPVLCKNFTYYAEQNVGLPSNMDVVEVAYGRGVDVPNKTGLSEFGGQDFRGSRVRVIATEPSLVKHKNVRGDIVSQTMVIPVPQKRSVWLKDQAELVTVQLKAQRVHIVALRANGTEQNDKWVYIQLRTIIEQFEKAVNRKAALDALVSSLNMPSSREFRDILERNFKLSGFTAIGDLFAGEPKKTRVYAAYLHQAFGIPGETPSFIPQYTVDVKDDLLSVQIALERGSYGVFILDEALKPLYMMPVNSVVEEKRIVLLGTEAVKLLSNEVKVERTAFHTLDITEVFPEDLRAKQVWIGTVSNMERTRDRLRLLFGTSKKDAQSFATITRLTELVLTNQMPPITAPLFAGVSVDLRKQFPNSDRATWWDKGSTNFALLVLSRTQLGDAGTHTVRLFEGGNLLGEVLVTLNLMAVCRRCDRPFNAADNPHGACQFHSRHPAEYLAQRKGKVLQQMVNADDSVEISEAIEAATLQDQTNYFKRRLYDDLTTFSVVCEDHKKLKLDLRGTVESSIATARPENITVSLEALPLTFATLKRLTPFDKRCANLFTVYETEEPGIEDPDAVLQGLTPKNPNFYWGVHRGFYLCCGKNDEGCWIGAHSAVTAQPDCSDMSFVEQRGTEWRYDPRTNEEAYQAIVAAKVRGDYPAILQLENQFNAVHGGVLTYGLQLSMRARELLKAGFQSIALTQKLVEELYVQLSRNYKRRFWTPLREAQRSYAERPAINAVQAEAVSRMLFNASSRTKRDMYAVLIEYFIELARTTPVNNGPELVPKVLLSGLVATNSDYLRTVEAFNLLNANWKMLGTVYDSLRKSERDATALLRFKDRNVMMQAIRVDNETENAKALYLPIEFLLNRHKEFIAASSNFYNRIDAEEKQYQRSLPREARQLLKENVEAIVEEMEAYLAALGRPEELFLRAVNTDAALKTALGGLELALRTTETDMPLIIRFYEKELPGVLARLEALLEKRLVQLFPLQESVLDKRFSAMMPAVEKLARQGVTTLETKAFVEEQFKRETVERIKGPLRPGEFDIFQLRAYNAFLQTLLIDRDLQALANAWLSDADVAELLEFYNPLTSEQMAAYLLEKTTIRREKWFISDIERGQKQLAPITFFDEVFSLKRIDPLSLKKRLEKDLFAGKETTVVVGDASEQFSVAQALEVIVFILDEGKVVPGDLAILSRISFGGDINLSEFNFDSPLLAEFIGLLRLLYDHYVHYADTDVSVISQAYFDLLTASLIKDFPRSLQVYAVDELKDILDTMPVTKRDLSARVGEGELLDELQALITLLLNEETGATDAVDTAALIRLLQAYAGFNEEQILAANLRPLERIVVEIDAKDLRTAAAIMLQLLRMPKARTYPNAYDYAEGLHSFVNSATSGSLTGKNAAQYWPRTSFIANDVLQNGNANIYEDVLRTELERIEKWSGREFLLYFLGILDLGYLGQDNFDLGKFESTEVKARQYKAPPTRNTLAAYFGVNVSEDAYNTYKGVSTIVYFYEPRVETRILTSENLIDPVNTTYSEVRGMARDPDTLYDPLRWLGMPIILMLAEDRDDVKRIRMTRGLWRTDLEQEEMDEIDDLIDALTTILNNMMTSTHRVLAKLVLDLWRKDPDTIFSYPGKKSTEANPLFLRYAIALSTDDNMKALYACWDTILGNIWCDLEPELRSYTVEKSSQVRTLYKALGKCFSNPSVYSLIETGSDSVDGLRLRDAFNHFLAAFGLYKSTGKTPLETFASRLAETVTPTPATIAAYHSYEDDLPHIAWSSVYDRNIPEDALEAYFVPDEYLLEAQDGLVPKRKAVPKFDGASVTLANIEKADESTDAHKFLIERSTGIDVLIARQIEEKKKRIDKNAKKVYPDLPQAAILAQLRAFSEVVFKNRPDFSQAKPPQSLVDLDLARLQDRLPQLLTILEQARDEYPQFLQDLFPVKEVEDKLNSLVAILDAEEQTQATLNSVDALLSCYTPRAEKPAETAKSFQTRLTKLLKNLATQLGKAAFPSLDDYMTELPEGTDRGAVETYLQTGELGGLTDSRFFGTKGSVDWEELDKELVNSITSTVVAKSQFEKISANDRLTPERLALFIRVTRAMEKIGDPWKDFYDQKVFQLLDNVAGSIQVDVENEGWSKLAAVQHYIVLINALVTALSRRVFFESWRVGRDNEEADLLQTQFVDNELDTFLLDNADLTTLEVDFAKVLNKADEVKAVHEALETAVDGQTITVPFVVPSIPVRFASDGQEFLYDLCTELIILYKNEFSNKRLILENLSSAKQDPPEMYKKDLEFPHLPSLFIPFYTAAKGPSFEWRWLYAAYKRLPEIEITDGPALFSLLAQVPRDPPKGEDVEIALLNPAENYDILEDELLILEVPVGTLRQQALRERRFDSRRLDANTFFTNLKAAYDAVKKENKHTLSLITDYYDGPETLDTATTIIKKFYGLLFQTNPSRKLLFEDLRTPKQLKLSARYNIYELDFQQVAVSIDTSRIRISATGTTLRNLLLKVAEYVYFESGKKKLRVDLSELWEFTALESHLLFPAFSGTEADELNSLGFAITNGTANPDRSNIPDSLISDSPPSHFSLVQRDSGTDWLKPNREADDTEIDIQEFVESWLDQQGIANYLHLSAEQRGLLFQMQFRSKIY
jgi:hypothetical protein